MLDTQKTTEVYINLNAKMLPFKGLLNFLEAGFDLFFFSKNKSLLELRFSLFKKFLEENLGLKKSSFYVEEKIFLLEASSVRGKKLVVTRKSSHLIEISEGSVLQFYCLVPSFEKKKKTFLLGEMSLGERKEPFFLSYAQIFFDSLVSSKDKERDTFFLSLVIYKVFLQEVKKISFLFREKLTTVVSALQQRGFLRSFSKENSRVVNSLISELDLSSWLYERFFITRNEDLLEEYSLDFNIELVVLRLKVFFSVFMILLVKRGYFSSFLSCEFYLRQVLFVRRSEESFQLFLENIGEDKFQYFVLQFFPEFLNDV